MLQFAERGGGREVVHDTGIVGTDELAVDKIAGNGVNGITIDFAVTINDAVLP